MQPKVGCLGVLAVVSGILTVVWCLGDPPGSYPMVWTGLTLAGMVFAFAGMARMIVRRDNLKMRFRNPRVVGAKSFAFGFTLLAAGHCGLLIDVPIWSGKTPETLGEFLTFVIAFFVVMELPIALATVIPLVRNILAARVVSIVSVELVPPTVRRGEPLTVKLVLRGGPAAGRNIDVEATVRSWQMSLEYAPATNVYEVARPRKIMRTTMLTQDGTTILPELRIEPNQTSTHEGKIIVPAMSRATSGNSTSGGVYWDVEIRLRIQGAPDWIERHELEVL